MDEARIAEIRALLMDSFDVVFREDIDENYSTIYRVFVIKNGDCETSLVYRNKNRAIEIRDGIVSKHEEELRVAVHDLLAEVDRLNHWADSITDSFLKERRTGEEYIKELQDKVDRLKRENTRLRDIIQGISGCLYCDGAEVANRKMEGGEGE